MNYATSMLILFAAAVLEAGGDAFIRAGIDSALNARRIAYFVLGARTDRLRLRGDAPRWDFHHLLGVYVAFFCVVAQAIAWIAFDQRLSDLSRRQLEVCSS
jgi:hypothetical protein